MKSEGRCAQTNLMNQPPTLSGMTPLGKSGKVSLLLTERSYDGPILDAPDIQPSPQGPRGDELGRLVKGDGVYGLVVSGQGLGALAHLHIPQLDRAVEGGTAAATAMVGHTPSQIVPVQGHRQLNCTHFSTSFSPAMTWVRILLQTHIPQPPR